MKSSQSRFKMVASQSPFLVTDNRKLHNPFEGRISQEEIDEGFFSLSIEQISETYSNGQIESLMEEMYYLSDDYENSCIEKLMLFAKK